MRSSWFRAWRKKTGRSLHLEGLFNKERDVTADLEEKAMWSAKRETSKKQICTQTPSGFMILVTVFRSGPLRLSLWMKLSWNVVPGRCDHALALMYICAWYNSHFGHVQTCQTSLPSSKICLVSDSAAE